MSDRNFNNHKGRIIFRNNNIKLSKTVNRNIIICAVISFIFGILGAFVFTLFSINRIHEDYKEIMSSEYNVTNVINSISNSLVGVNAYVREDIDDGFNLLERNTTGIIYSEDGYIVTNFQNIRDSSSVYVKIPSAINLVKQAHVVGYDEVYDICVLKIDGESYNKANFKTNTNDIIQGIKVISIGNMFGDPVVSSVTTGTLSGFDLSGNKFGFKSNKCKLIKSDLNVNITNTGGPVCDVNGNIIGINSLVLTEEYRHENISVCVSSIDVIDIIEDIILSAT